MKRLFDNKEEFIDWISYYKTSKFYVNSYEEEEPLNYPCVVIYNETENFNSYKDNLDYEFVYLEDFTLKLEDLKVDIKYDPKVTYTPIRRHDNETNSDVTFYVTNCTKVVSPIYKEELENCRKEIQSMLNGFLKTPNNLTRSIIKIKAQQIIDTYICEQKIPDFITENDFTIIINNEQYEYH